MSILINKNYNSRSKFLLNKKIHTREIRHLAMWRFEAQGRSFIRYAVLNRNCMGEIRTLNVSNNLNLDSGPLLTSSQYIFNRDEILKTILDANYDNAIITQYMPPTRHELITYVPFHSVDEFILNFMSVQIDPFLEPDSSFSSSDPGIDFEDLGEIEYDTFGKFFNQAINSLFLSEITFPIWKEVFILGSAGVILTSSGILINSLELQELSSIQGLVELFSYAISSRTP